MDIRLLSVMTGIQAAAISSSWNTSLRWIELRRETIEIFTEAGPPFVIFEHEIKKRHPNIPNMRRKKDVHCYKHNEN